MDKNIEKELKILVNKEQFTTLLQKYEPLCFHTQVNIYYDTYNNDIQKKKGAMRIRSKNNKHIFTLKMFLNDDLYEYECETNTNDLSALENRDILNLLHSYEIQGPFQKTAMLETKRAVYESEYAELCFDISSYNDAIDYEIEYEYKIEHDGISLFNEILKDINLVYTHNCKSKIQRALNK